MAFNFIKSNKTESKTSINTKSTQNTKNDDTLVPKLTNAQLNKLTKVYPAWLRNNSSLKQLPGVYQGVLGQVQLQPIIHNESRFVNGRILARKQQHLDYLNRFTDTQRVYEIFLLSRLGDENLSKIWAFANKTYPGQLTNREVLVGLALIALFQKLDCNNNNDSSKSSNKSSTDPFVEFFKIDQPPLPKLYPPDNNNKLPKYQIKTSKSMPEELSQSSSLLIDIDDQVSDQGQKKSDQLKNLATNKSICDISHRKAIDKFNGNLVSLIDMDGGGFEIGFLQTWLKDSNLILRAIKSIFKQSFDTLNVYYSRHHAIEALKSDRGKNFINNIGLCYPLAHNLKLKVDELKNMKNFGFFDKNYIMQIDDLNLINEYWVGINQYWLVLINLFNESGRIEYVEKLMDSLNTATETDITFEDFVNKLSSSGKSCSICLTKFYLLQSSDTQSEDENSLVESELVTLDNRNYYHVPCATFYQNNVGPLPCQREPDATNLLTPTNSV